MQYNKIPNFIKKQDSTLIESNFNNYRVLNTTNLFNIAGSDIDLFINLEKMNNFRRINKFHEAINLSLTKNGIYCCCAETIDQRNTRKKKNRNLFIKPILLLIDFIYKRVIPKLPIIKKIYFMLTRGHNRVMSKTEIIGRLISCGFEIQKVFEHEDLTYIFCRRINPPSYDMAPSYGPIFKMKRVGKDGKIITVYKFRTMSPYSEYTQKKIIDDNKLDTSGKIKNDYRITFYGKFLRRYWIDEFPMIINWLKRDLKLVGVRPLSEDYFKRYPKDLQQLRIKTKPGLVPPYYVDLPVTFEEICQSERNYLNQYIEHPLKTDLKYFFKAFYNIIIKRNRSS